MIWAAVQWIALAAFAPLLQGVMKRLRARLQGRPGPSPWQPYRDLRKLWAKEAVLPVGGSGVAVVAPGIVLGGALTFLALVPPLGNGPASLDPIAIVLVLAASRFVLVAAALDSRSGFAALAASREMAFAALTEAPLVLAPASAALAARAGTAGHAPVAAILAAAALVLVMLSETARIPVDNQETHYELTMIHEGLVLEYSGWQLAWLQYAAYVRQAAFFALAAVLLPGGIAASCAWFALLAGAFPVVERSFAKLRLFEVPQLFASATMLALASIGLQAVGLGAW